MPFGFTKFLEDHNNSIETITTYNSTVNDFFSVLDYLLPSELEVFEIQARHIKMYLDYIEKSRGTSISTINRNITILKKFFDYLWESNQISIDPMSKIRRKKESKYKESKLDYQLLINLKTDILNNSNIDLLSKVIYIFALRGFTQSEMRVKKDDIYFLDDKVIINVLSETQYQSEIRTIMFDGEDAEIIYQLYLNASFKATPYLLTRRLQNKDVEIHEYAEKKKIKDKIKELKEHVSALEHFNLIESRKAYIIHLYKELSFSINQIGYLMCRRPKSIIQLINKHDPFGHYPVKKNVNN